MPRKTKEPYTLTLSGPDGEASITMTEAELADIIGNVRGSCLDVTRELMWMFAAAGGDVGLETQFITVEIVDVDEDTAMERLAEALAKVKGFRGLGS